MRNRRAGIAVLTAWLVMGVDATAARGDGGTLRCSERRGDHLISVFTAPTPVRAGLADVSVLVQDAASGRPLLDVPIRVRARPVRDAHGTVSVPATGEAATNKLLRAALVEFTTPGTWHVEIAGDGLGWAAPIEFDVEVAEALPPWLQMIPWIGWPLLAIAAFALHPWLERRSRPRGKIPSVGPCRAAPDKSLAHCLRS